MKKGYRQTEEHIEKRISRIRGLKRSPETKQKMRKPHKKFSIQVRQKLSLARKGRFAGENNPMWKGGKPKCVDCKKNLSDWKAKRCRRCKEKFFSKSNCHFWKGGVSKLNDSIRHSFEYKLWRKSVFERDNYTCIWCGQIGGKLNADHIKRFADYPELRFAIDNGRTLCKTCHLTTETYGNKK